MDEKFASQNIILYLKAVSILMCNTPISKKKVVVPILKYKIPT